MNDPRLPRRSVSIRTIAKRRWDRDVVTVCIGLLSGYLACHAASGEDWPSWRGPAGTGVSVAKAAPPVKWGPKENVRWRVPLPDRGNSSPIVWDDRVFITQALSNDHRRMVMCFNRASGKLLWQSGVTYAEYEPTQRDNPYCSATPVADGERVIASFGSAGLYCYDFAGKELWHRDFGKMDHIFGNASSPILIGDLCILYFGPDEKSRLIAVNKNTGQTAWEVMPPKLGQGEKRTAGGFGGGGRGGVGPGRFLAPQMLAQADKKGNQKITKEEFTALADAWYDKLDPDKTGKLSQEQFTERLSGVLAPPQGAAPGASPREGRASGAGQRPGRGGSGRGRFLGPALFAAADVNKDGSLTRDEFKTTFAKWFANWDKDKTGSLDEDKLRDGLNAMLPQPQFGGRGGPGAPAGRGPGGPGSFRGFGGGATWSTPIVIKVDGHDELIMNFPGRLAAYDPPTGKQLWISKELGQTIYTTPVWADGVLVATGSDTGGGSAMALKPGGSGDVTESRRIWHLDRFKNTIGSGVIHEGYFYSIGRDGIAECLDLKSGKSIWQHRLAGTGGRGSSWSSMLLSHGRIYLPNQAGDVFVLRAAPKFELLATNSIDEFTNSSLAESDGELFLRTDQALWCLGNGKETVPAP